MPIPVVEKIWMNGELVPWDDARVHVLTHALHYGSGVFEGVRAYETARGPAVFRLTDHLRRLERSAKLYYMPLPYSVEEFTQATKDVIVANDLKACYIRPLAFRGYGEMGLFPLRVPVECVIAVWPWGAYLGDEGIRHGIRAKVSSIQALGHTQLARAAKATGHYLNSILAKLEVANAGYDEAIMLDEHGRVCEGSGENLFVVRDGVLYTPPAVDGILEGITRDTVLRIAASEGIEARERTLARSDLVVADELFFTGTAAEVVPIREVDDHPIGEPGPVTRRVQERYRAVVEGRDEEFGHYLEYVTE
ncbi:MAG TPA: branched-chain amino acid transaminase [Thermoleophilia bacterium]|nr:branched-chain amino acid transaminase [Thermoleophilia bacterium]